MRPLLLALLATGCAWTGDDAVRATFSTPTTRIGEFADEGDPYRLSLGYGLGLRPDLTAWSDLVASYIEVNDFEGANGGTTYGLGLDLSLRWHRPLAARTALWLEGGGGMQNTFPISFVAPGSHFNFTILLGAGLQLATHSRWTPSIGLRYLHMSNANLLPNNNGYDGVSAIVGVERRL